MTKIYLVIIFLLFVLVLPLSASALTISPAKFVLSADPGEIITSTINIRSDLDATVTFYPTFLGFTMKGGGGEPFFLEDTIDLASWIKTEPEAITVKPGETRGVSIIINIPEDADPGGHYAAIFWSSANPKGGGAGSVGVMTRVGALILLEVSGDVVESAELLDFSTLNEKRFFTHLPIGFNYTLKNMGTVHLSPVGKVIIKNIFGKISATLNINPQGFNVLPNSTRTFDTQNWEPKGSAEIEGKGFFSALKREMNSFHLGFYRASLDLEYGKEIKTIKSSFSFLILPWRFLILSILGLAIVFFGIIKGIKAYNRWIINQVRNKMQNSDGEAVVSRPSRKKRLGKKFVR